MHDKYKAIIADIKAAWAANDDKAYKRHKKRLERWQKEYGAYAPIR